MHVLILPMYYPEPNRSGHLGYLFYEQAMQVARAGCQVGLAYVEQRLPRTFTWQIFRRESHFQITEEDNGTFRTLRMHGWNPKLTTLLGGFIWAVLTLLLVRSYIKRHGKPDIIHAHFGLWAGYAARLIHRFYKIPYVVTEHSSSVGSKKLTDAQQRILRTAYKEAGAVICVSSRLRQSVLDMQLATPTQAIVVPNFVDIDAFKVSSRRTDKTKEFVFVGIGNLIPMKGFDLLIDAFARSFRELTHVSLVIAGGGEEADNLQRLIDTLGMSQRIHLPGRLSRQEIIALLGRSDAFVLSSHIETFGVVLIEAMATGLPAVSTLCGGPADIITPTNGYFVPTGDAEQLAEKMRLLYDNYEQFDRTLIRRSVSERFDFRLAGDKLKAVYQRFIPNHP